MELVEIIQNALGSKNVSSASDIHLVYGLPPKMRRDGKLDALEGAPALDDAQCIKFANELAGDQWGEVENGGELDLARTYGQVRIRGNLFWQQGHISSAIRLLSDNIPALEALGLPSVVSTFPDFKRGVVLVTGVTGSGKSTTLASILQRINETRYDHIVTLEDPIEYIYHPQRCVINQREINRDTDSYASGLKAVLREDPDVILIGEMRDLETIQIALTAAETGHLVFATLHTASAPDSVDRIVEVFPTGMQKQIRMQLSQTLQAVLSQQLLPRAGGIGRVCACEVMVVNHAIRNLIREGKTPQIANALATSADEGGITMDNAILRLLASRVITPETALRAARDPELLSKSFV